MAGEGNRGPAYAGTGFIGVVRLHLAWRRSQARDCRALASCSHGGSKAARRSTRPRMFRERNLLRRWSLTLSVPATHPLGRGRDRAAHRSYPNGASHGHMHRQTHATQETQGVSGGSDDASGRASTSRVWANQRPSKLTPLFAVLAVSLFGLQQKWPVCGCWTGAAPPAFEAGEEGRSSDVIRILMRIIIPTHFRHHHQHCRSCALCRCHPHFPWFPSFHGSLTRSRSFDPSTVHFPCSRLGRPSGVFQSLPPAVADRPRHPHPQPASSIPPPSPPAPVSAGTSGGRRGAHRNGGKAGETRAKVTSGPAAPLPPPCSRRQASWRRYMPRRRSRLGRRIRAVTRSRSRLTGGTSTPR